MNTRADSAKMPQRGSRTLHTTTSSNSSRPHGLVGRVPLTLLAALALALTAPAHAGTQLAPIPFSDVGTRATAGYHGNALGVAATADGARLRCGFQKLEARATAEGLWLESVVPGAEGKLHLIATALRREENPTANPQATGALPVTGCVSVENKLVRFTRPGLTEEYSVSVDGVRQDFVIFKPPVGMGDLRMELTLSGARANAAACGVRLTLDDSGRALAYSRLRVEDAMGRELEARLEVLSAERLAVSVADANATYPVRIDPTFSDANWVSLNPGIPGANGMVLAIMADGSGNVYVGGTFTVIGTVPASAIARWNGSTWSGLGSGMKYYDSVYALAMLGTNLYVAGFFDTAGGLTVNGIAKWDGNAWSALGSGMNGGVRALAVSGNNLYAGGGFSTAGGVPANGIAKWNGSAWSPLGSGMAGTYPVVYALAVTGTDLYAGGYFATAGGVQASNIAKWDGSAWSALGSGFSQEISGQGLSVDALAVIGTNLYAGGHFTKAGGVPANSIAKWDGNAWSALGSGVSNPYSTVNALAVNGTDLYAGGQFTGMGGVPANYLAKWDGNAWSALRLEVNGGVYALTIIGADLYAGGQFTTAGGVPANYIAKWNRNVWSALGSGMNADVYALAVSGNNLYAGGLFTTTAGGAANYVAKWDGSAWSALGSGISSHYNCIVRALAVSGTDLYAGGYFTNAGGVTANCIAKWDGNAWSTLGSGVNYEVTALVVSGSNLYVGGGFSAAGGVPANAIAKWDGNAWSALGSGLGGVYPYRPYVYALTVIGTNLYAGGLFTTAGGVSATNIAKWDGSAWSALGSGLRGYLYYQPCVYALAVSGTNLYAGGYFTNAGGVTANCIAKWDGSAWSALGSGMRDQQVFALAVSGTDLYVGGWFTWVGGTPVNHIAKWDGSAWSALGSGMDHAVWALAVDGVGHLFLGGYFSLAGTTVSPFIAQANLNRPPVAGTPFIKVIGDEVSEIPARRFVIWCSDPDNDPLSVTAVTSPSAMGALVTLETNQVSYAPPLGFLGDDIFGYTITDGNGGFASSTALVLVEPRILAAATMLPPITSPGALQVKFTGFADLGYTVERAESLDGPWTALGDVLTDDDGTASFVDRNAPVGNAFYRAVH